MNRPLSLTALLLALSACGGAETAGPATPSTAAGAATPQVEKQKLVNVEYFDLATIAPSPPAITGRPGNDALLGIDLAARPVLLECLVDPRNRGPEKKTHVVIDTALAEAGVQHTVTGQNLTATGTACLEGKLKAWTKGIAGGPGAPAKSHLELDHVVGANAAVVLGVNDASDVAAAVRLALPGWGDCFAPWTSAAPRSLKATVVAAKAKDTSPAVLLASVAFDPSTDPAAVKVAACLEGKLKALPIKPPSSDSVTVPYTFRLVHSGLSGLLPDAPPDLQLVELDLQRARRLSDVAIAIGERAEVLGVYDDLVKRFKSKAKPEVTIAQLKDRCAALLVAGDKLLAAAEKQASTEDATHRFAEEQKAKDPSWTEAEVTAAKSLADAQKDLAAYKTLRKADEGACPKVSY